MNFFTCSTIFTLTFICGVLRASTPPPTWWSVSGTAIIDSESDPEHYAPANLGQLKHVAQKARLHLEGYLPGGADHPINNLVSSFEPRSGQGYTPEEIADFIEGNYAPINLGQLKAIAKPFYDRLLQVGYDTRANLIARGYPSSWPHDYPWNPSTPVEENYSPANLGQLKVVFSFDLSSMAFDPLADFDEDGLPDSWEGDIFGDLTQTAASDPDGDGLSNLTEYLAGTHPQQMTGQQGPAFTATGLKVFTPLE